MATDQQTALHAAVRDILTMYRDGGITLERATEMLDLAYWVARSDRENQAKLNPPAPTCSIPATQPVR